MPELPEVEVSRMGIAPYLVGKTIEKIVVRQPQLRWPVPHILQDIRHQTVRAVRRRAKYLLLELDTGTILIHLGMSGHLRILNQIKPPNKHDHIDLVLEEGHILRYHDPRRFGAWLWAPSGEEISVIKNLGPEPLTDAFNGDELFRLSRKRTKAIKSFIMDNKIVVGVGNIYANEALFLSGIHPKMPTQQLTKEQCHTLVNIIKQVLTQAITQGGTTLKDFNQADGKPGYFSQELQVYGKAGEACPVCQHKIQEEKIAQRNSFYCQVCQVY